MKKISHKTIFLVFMLFAGLLLAGCVDSFADQTNPGVEKSSPGPSEPPGDETPERSELRATPSLPTGMGPIEIPQPEPVSGEVSDEILAEIIADLIERTGAEREEIQVVRAEAVMWNDGSLGCPKPSEVYIQILVNGYWVVLEVEGIEYDYRVSGTDHFTLCEGRGSLPISPLGDPGGGVENSLVIQAKGDLAKRLNIPVKEIDLFSFEEVVWPDASLGCPQPGMVYIQVPQDGALIRLSAKGQVYDYHSGGNRGVFLCEQVFKLKTITPKIDIIKHTPPPRDTGDQ